MTALSLSRMEVLWEFVRCAYPIVVQKKKETLIFKDRLHESQKSKKNLEVESPTAVGFLMERMVAVQSLILRYRSSICHHRIEILQVNQFFTP